MNLLTRHLMGLTGGAIVTVVYRFSTKINRLVKLFRNMDEKNPLPFILGRSMLQLDGDVQIVPGNIPKPADNIFGLLSCRCKLRLNRC